MKRALLIALFLLSLTPSSLFAQRFEEDDWTAWGDSRQINVMTVGRDYIYVGTSAGVYRFHRYDKTWEDPWYSVPGMLDRAIHLRNVTAIYQDPLTFDLYLRTNGQWIVRESNSRRWQMREPDPSAKERFEQSGKPVRPNPAWMPPWKYDLATDGTLSLGFLRWKYSSGLEDQYGNQILAWKGFGLGVSDTYHNQVELYPLGPSSAVAMERVGDLIWCAGQIDRRGGHVWTYDEKEQRWDFFSSEEIYDLQPAMVYRIVSGGDGTVWLATNRGVYRYQRNSWKRFRKQENLPTEEIRDIAATASGAWIATNYGVAFLSSTSPLVKRPDREIQPEAATGMFSAIASDGNIVYAGAAGLLLRRNPLNDTWEPVEGPPFVAAATPPLTIYAESGTLAVGDREGFAWRDPEQKWHEYLSHNWRYGTVFAIERHGGYWWLGTDKGLVRLNPDNDRVILYGPEEGLSGGGSVYAIRGEGDYLWLGTEEALVRFHWYRGGRTE